MSRNFQFGKDRYLYLPAGEKQALTELTHSASKGVNSMIWHDDYFSIINESHSASLSTQSVGTRVAARNLLDAPYTEKINRSIGFTVRYKPEEPPGPGDVYGSWDYFEKTLSYAEMYQLEIAVMHLDAVRGTFPGSGWAANCHVSMNHSFDLTGLVTIDVNLDVYQWYHPIRYDGQSYLFTPVFNYVSGYFPPAEVT